MAFSRYTTMKQKRILAVHDISCVGRCSLTVALPIISSVGIECSVLPTAVLSTHTGGFKGYTYRDLTEDIMPIDAHWQTLGLKMDAVYTGFLGSFEQIDLVSKLFDDVSDDGTVIYVDPVMADKGVLYPVFGPDFPAGMRKLCEKANVIMPNMTELTLMLGEEYKDGPYTHDYVDSMFEKARVFGVDKIIITGVSFEKGVVGAVFMDYVTGTKGECMRPEIPGYYHGTGDVFGSALVAACEYGLSLKEAVSCAVELTVNSIISTHSAGDDVRYGVRFEESLYDYVTMVRNSGGPRIIRAVSDSEIRLVSSVAESVWMEAYAGVVPDDQICYMLRNYQTFESIRKQIDDGYIYDALYEGGKIRGFVGYTDIPSKKMVFLSKIYILADSRGKGYADILFGCVEEYAKARGEKVIQLTVNRNNANAISVYEHHGFKKIAEEDKDIGCGYVMNDFVMELEL